VHVLVRIQAFKNQWLLQVRIAFTPKILPLTHSKFMVFFVVLRTNTYYLHRNIHSVISRSKTNGVAVIYSLIDCIAKLFNGV
jgi:hypothetical protein